MDEQAEQKLSDRITFINIWIIIHFVLTCFMMWALITQQKDDIRLQNQFDRIIKAYQTAPAEELKGVLKQAENNEQKIIASQKKREDILRRTRPCKRAWSEVE